MTLVELPGNGGQVFAVDPHHVTAVQAHRSTLPGRGGQLFDMTAVWAENRALFVCSWSVEHTLRVLNDARHGEAALFEAGYRAGLAEYRPINGIDIEAAWRAYLEGRRTPDE